jgi:hypothetical protein
MGVGAIFPFGETRGEKRLVEQRAGEIPGERSAGSVRTGAAGRQTDDQKSGGGVAKRGGRTVEPVRMRRLILGAIGDEPRTERAIAPGFGGRAQWSIAS